MSLAAYASETNYSFEIHMKIFEIAISSEFAPFSFIQSWIFGSISSQSVAVISAMYQF